ncbi:MAG: DUF5652 family protein [Candidatus Pacebacteria bacterium]|nr:DUF5652 family protein [Candidatus Paceibacterota bacterium]
MTNYLFQHPWGVGPTFLGFGAAPFVLLLLVVAVITALKGYALWNAAKRDERGWFIALLIVNTLGILEIVYLVFVVKKKS